MKIESKTKEQIRELVSQMTLEEKAALTSGNGPWLTKEIERLGIPAMWMSDGPHGLRKQENWKDEPDVNDSLPAVSFPAECALAASWDREVLRSVGSTLGREAQTKNVQLVLGPGVNMKRSPLCGRNFEYLSEDPHLAGELASAYVEGMQGEGTGACVKHYLANSQETRRFTSSSEVDERTLREIYMPAFETVIKKAKPMAVMASYNKINGTYATESRDRLVDVLRGEWKYDGCVISDWGATHDRPKAVAAGCALTMPGDKRELDRDHEVSNAVHAGLLDEKDLDAACEQILGMVYQSLSGHKDGIEPAFEAEHAIAREAEEQSAVLLKNEDGILPLKSGQKLAIIGDFAKRPRYQGGGSSHVNPVRMSNAYEELAGAFGEDAVSFALGYPEIAEARQLTDPDFAEKKEKHSYKPDEALIAEAVQAARNADVALIFAGLPEDLETEGDDRLGLDLPEDQNALIAAVAKAQPNTVVLLQNGSPVAMPWISSVKGLLELYLGGEAVGEATANLLLGRVNPSGRLPESFPLRLEDNSSYLSYFGIGDRVEYREGVHIGYRYYESKKQEVLFPFGYGLSYTEFAYSDLKIETEGALFAKALTEDLAEAARSGGFPEARVKLRVKVRNIGTSAGREVVQLYVDVKKCEVLRPVTELKGFAKVLLQPGEEQEVSFELSARDFAYWEMEGKRFAAAPGEFALRVGKNAHEAALTAPLKIEE